MDHQLEGDVYEELQERMRFFEYATCDISTTDPWPPEIYEAATKIVEQFELWKSLWIEK